jgi:hypothetical protein
MAYITAAWVAVAVAAAVLVFGTYYRGGFDALRENARTIGTLLLAAIALVVVLSIVSLAAGT